MAERTAVRARSVGGVIVTVRIAPSDLALVDLVAVRHGVTRSDLVRQAVDEFLTTHAEEIS